MSTSFYCVNATPFHLSNTATRSHSQGQLKACQHSKQGCKRRNKTRRPARQGRGREQEGQEIVVHSQCSCAMSLVWQPAMATGRWSGRRGCGPLALALALALVLRSRELLLSSPCNYGTASLEEVVRRASRDLRLALAWRRVKLQRWERGRQLKAHWQHWMEATQHDTPRCPHAHTQGLAPSLGPPTIRPCTAHLREATVHVLIHLHDGRHVAAAGEWGREKGHSLPASTRQRQQQLHRASTSSHR